MLAVASCGQSDEIRSDNELGEYVLAKTKTLAIEPYLFPKKEMNEIGEATNEEYRKYRECFDDLGHESCSRIYLDNDYKEKVERYNVLAELEKTLPGKKPVIQVIRWRGIAKLVGTERIKLEKSAYCFNPKITPETRAKWEKVSGEKAPMPDEKGKDEMYEVVEAELCKRYAKF